MPTCVAYEPFTTVEVVRERGCDCIGDLTPDADIERWIDEASDTIAAATGMRIAGTITLKARPCRDDWCTCQCPCCGLDSIWLGDQLISVDAVRIDGDLIDPSWYSIHHSPIGFNLVRVGPSVNGQRPPRWPSLNRRWLADTEQHTWSIDFTVGACMDSEIILDAVMELICDSAAQANSDGWKWLDNGVVTATIGGVQVTVDPARVQRLQSGSIGPATEKMIGLLAPGGPQPAGAVWAPELTAWQLNANPVTVNP